MKKLIALTMMLCLLCTAAFAESAALVWEGDVEALAATKEGEFKTFDEISVKIWIPATLVEIELSEEDRQNGYIGYIQREDGSAAIAVQYVDMNGLTLEDYQALLQQNGVAETEPGTVNGLPALSYEYNGNGVVAFTTELGYILEVSCGPLADETFAEEASIAMCSIQAAE